MVLVGGALEEEEEEWRWWEFEVKMEQFHCCSIDRMQGMIAAAAAAACASSSSSSSSSSPRFLCKLALTTSSGGYNRNSVKCSASSNSITEQEAATASVGSVIRYLVVLCACIISLF